MKTIWKQMFTIICPIS